MPKKRDFDKMSVDTGLACDPAKDVTRQEFKADTDTHQILKKFGLGALTAKPIFGTTIDFDIDLQQAHQAVALAEHAHGQLPQQLRDKFPTWKAMLDAAENGELGQAFTELNKSKDEDAKRQAIEAQLTLEDARDRAKRAARAKAAADRELTREDEPPSPSN